MYALKTLIVQPFRFIITVSGVSLCVVLILFLLGIYKGASVGSVEYVRSGDSDLWVLQRHADNILRCTSILTREHSSTLKMIPGVQSVSPVLFILASIQLNEGPATVYLTGYKPGSGRGGPPEICSGRNIREGGEIVLDRSFAAKYHIKIGERLMIKTQSLKVVGFSKGTNMFVIQYAFISLADAHRIIGLPDIFTCCLLKVKPGEDLRSVSDDIEACLPDVVVFDREKFLANNIREMESGILPLLFIVAVIGAVVLMAILSLILTINVLERRKDFAIMKALGAPAGYIPFMVIVQSVVISVSGLISGIAAFFPLMSVVGKFSPEVSVMTSPLQVLAVIMSVIIISLFSSILPNRKLRKIYPLEVFR